MLHIKNFSLFKQAILGIFSKKQVIGPQKNLGNGAVKTQPLFYYICQFPSHHPDLRPLPQIVLHGLSMVAEDCSEYGRLTSLFFL
jgi:hypothetical protein